MEYVTGVPVSRVLRDIRKQHADQRERGAGLMEGPASDDSLPHHQGQEHQKRILDGELSPLKNRVADAVCFLLSIPKPPDTRPGPVGGGRIKHWTFGRDESDAPYEFSDVEHLETYVNEKISETFPDLPPARFVHEGLRLCYCDLNFDNFLLEDAEDPSGRIIIIDFEHASWLPYSFLTWEAWDKREFAVEERIRSRCGLELGRDNVYALYALLRQREWDSAITISPSN
ncbi:hypothetical protein CTA2_712 [Colletotrichum tanaceti]|uniref:Aminoglycoside phosphotransferase domain-containing protein n=1 Tax=Colletotrichum tanaceti TaxID=1306861 RepID=A0A4U6X2G9_9PEZI|nr:hypothetical protein CTA2_712 [Colletotrichum tanaceti]TKW49093.1 hypothetical protein CTA1_8172 [Colletotrichum tanaceti]